MWSLRALTPWIAALGLPLAVGCTALTDFGSFTFDEPVDAAPSLDGSVGEDAPTHPEEDVGVSEDAPAVPLDAWRCPVSFTLGDQRFAVAGEPFLALGARADSPDTSVLALRDSGELLVYSVGGSLTLPTFRDTTIPDSSRLVWSSLGWTIVGGTTGAGTLMCVPGAGTWDCQRIDEMNATSVAVAPMAGGDVAFVAVQDGAVVMGIWQTDRVVLSRRATGPVGGVGPVRIAVAGRTSARGPIVLGLFPYADSFTMGTYVGGAEELHIDDAASGAVLDRNFIDVNEEQASVVWRAGTTIQMATMTIDGSSSPTSFTLATDVRESAAIATSATGPYYSIGSTLYALEDTERACGVDLGFTILEIVSHGDELTVMGTGEARRVTAHR